jgi:hypothetical protein
VSAQRLAVEEVSLIENETKVNHADVGNGCIPSILKSTERIHFQFLGILGTSNFTP